MKINIIFPSRNRPEQAEKTLKKWIENAYNKKNISIILSIDSNDTLLRRYERLSNIDGVFVLVGKNKSAIEAINKSCKFCSGDVIVQIAEDFNEPPLHWDKLILEATNGKEDFLLKTQDGIQKTLVTLPIMDRKFYNRFGYIYYPGYQHLFSDQELTAVAHMTGRIITSDIYIPHNHYSTGKTPKDAVNKKNDKTWNQGKKLFHERLSTNFGLSNSDIVKPYSEIVWH